MAGPSSRTAGHKIYILSCCVSVVINDPLLTNEDTMRSHRLHNHLQHIGEHQVQSLCAVPSDLTMTLTNMIDEEMPEQHAIFFQNLSYFAVCVCDDEGRPWSTLLTRSITPVTPTFIHAVDSSHLQITCLVPRDDPCAINLKSGRCWAGLGVDFSNRRRNKVAGIIEHVKMDHNLVDGRVLLSLFLTTNENLGNCPKYITTRTLISVPDYPSPDNKVLSLHDPLLNHDEIEMIHHASTIYLATKHLDVIDPSSSDVGLNHRGGQPGFVRCWNFNFHGEKHGSAHNTKLVSYSVIYLPDYSGNRFFQSLGNVQSDRVAGLLVPDFITGDLLYITGTAENIFGADAELIMPRVQILTRIHVTGHVRIRRAIANLRLDTTSVPEQFSPYNPPVRLLRSEITDQIGGEYFSIDGAGITCRLVDVKQLTSRISTFIFETDQPFHPLETLLPGGYAIFDFSSILTRQYRHMNQADPKQVNDDLIRTWTISSGRDIADGRVRFSCTIKRSGLISSFLHNNRQSVPGQLVLPLKGVGGDFSCFARSSDRLSLVSKSMLWIAGGVGYTPFLSMLAELKKETNKNVDVDIHMLLAVRGDEEALADEFRQGAILRWVSIFNSSSSSSTHHASVNPNNSMLLYSVPTIMHQRRMTLDDIKQVGNLLERNIYLCGPIPFMEAVSGWLHELGVPPKSIHKESFF